ncbi:MAG: electron transport complex subunit E [Lachnospiraceae bacterium]|nr:electron transport complex subunit E [Lachnospiraceae bacterium]
MNKAGERLYNGLIKENPTFVLMLGMCPTLAVTTSAMNGLGMGLTTAAVLAMSNLIISLLRKVIPGKVRIPAFIVIIASFVTVLQLLLEAYLPDLNKALGVYIPLIVVNCIILGRAESYAYSNPPIPSLFDGIGMGLGFTFALTCIGAVRELLGAGEVFGYRIMPDSFTPIGIFVLAPGAFFILAALTAFQNYLKITRERVGKDAGKIQSGCSEDCMNCGNKGCSRRFYDPDAKDYEWETLEKPAEIKAAEIKVPDKSTDEPTPKKIIETEEPVIQDLIFIDLKKEGK